MLKLNNQIYAYVNGVHEPHEETVCCHPVCVSGPGRLKNKHTKTIHTEQANVFNSSSM